MRWIWVTLFLSGVTQMELLPDSHEIITVGSDPACHYPPDRLNQALREHNILYLSTDAVFPPIKINHSNVTLIGGLETCDKRHHFRNHSQKSVISGFNHYRPVSIKPSETTGKLDVELINLRIVNGYAETGGGLLIAGPAEVHLINSVIEHNTATLRGGGMALTGPYIMLQLINSLVQFNQAEKLGGGISCEGEHRIKLNQEQQIHSNLALLAEDYLLAQSCFVNIN